MYLIQKCRESGYGLGYIADNIINDLIDESSRVIVITSKTFEDFIKLITSGITLFIIIYGFYYRLSITDIIIISLMISTFLLLIIVDLNFVELIRLIDIGCKEYLSQILAHEQERVSSLILLSEFMEEFSLMRSVYDGLQGKKRSYIEDRLYEISRYLIIRAQLGAAGWGLVFIIFLILVFFILPVRVLYLLPENSILRHVTILILSMNFALLFLWYKTIRSPLETQLPLFEGNKFLCPKTTTTKFTATLFIARRRALSLLDRQSSNLVTKGWTLGVFYFASIFTRSLPLEILILISIIVISIAYYAYNIYGRYSALIGRVALNYTYEFSFKDIYTESKLVYLSTSFRRMLNLIFQFIVASILYVGIFMTFRHFYFLSFQNPIHGILAILLISSSGLYVLLSIIVLVIDFKVLNNLNRIIFT